MPVFMNYTLKAKNFSDDLTRSDGWDKTGAGVEGAVTGAASGAGLVLGKHIIGAGKDKFEDLRLNQTKLNDQEFENLQKFINGNKGATSDGLDITKIRQRSQQERFWNFFETNPSQYKSRLVELLKNNTNAPEWLADMAAKSLRGNTVIDPANTEKTLAKIEKLAELSGTKSAAFYEALAAKLSKVNSGVLARLMENSTSENAQRIVNELLDGTSKLIGKEGDVGQGAADLLQAASNNRGISTHVNEIKNRYNVSVTEEQLDTATKKVRDAERDLEKAKSDIQNLNKESRKFKQAQQKVKDKQKPLNKANEELTQLKNITQYKGKMDSAQRRAKHEAEFIGRRFINKADELLGVQEAIRVGGGGIKGVGKGLRATALGKIPVKVGDTLFRAGRRGKTGLVMAGGAVALATANIISQNMAASVEGNIDKKILTSKNPRYVYKVSDSIFNKIGSWFGGNNIIGYLNDHAELQQITSQYSSSLVHYYNKNVGNPPISLKPDEDGYNITDDPELMYVAMAITNFSDPIAQLKLYYKTPMKVTGTADGDTAEFEWNNYDQVTVNLKFASGEKPDWKNLGRDTKTSLANTKCDWTINQKPADFLQNCIAPIFTIFDIKESSEHNLPPKPHAYSGGQIDQPLNTVGFKYPENSDAFNVRPFGNPKDTV